MSATRALAGAASPCASLPAHSRATGRRRKRHRRSVRARAIRGGRIMVHERGIQVGNA